MCSACLAGMACKYSGVNNNTSELIVELLKQGEVIPVCPEMLGGLLTPRVPCEIVDGKVINRDGIDVTLPFFDGASKAMALAKKLKVEKVILMSRSPSCGVGQIYDGTFTGTLKQGNGIFTKMLLKEGIEVQDIKDFEKSYIRKEQLNHE